MEKATALSEIEELIHEGKKKVLSTKWDFSGTDIIGFGTYVDGDIFYSWRMKTLSFLRLFLPHDHEYAKVFENLTDTLIEYDVPFISVENNGSEDDLTAAANIVTKHLNRTGVSL